MKNFKIVLAGLFMIVFAVIAMPILALASDMPPSDFLAQVLEAIKSLGGLPWVGKVAAIVALLVSSMKVSFLRGLIWDKLGAAQAYVAPALALLGGVLSLPELSLQGLMAYLFAGAGAIILHELLDSLKSLPGLGSMAVAIIDFISRILGGAKS